MNTNFRDYLIAFRKPLMTKYNDLLSTRTQLLKTEEPVFHNEINTQFYNRLAKELAVELASNFETTPEEIRSFLERFDLERWLNGEH